MSFRRLCLLVLTTVFFAGPVTALNVNNPPSGTFVDEWYVVMIKGKKSGHAHITLKRTQRPGGDMISARTDMVLEMNRAGQTVAVRVIQQSDETVEGVPLGFMNTMRLGAMQAQNLRGTVEGNKITVTGSQFGQETEPKVYELPKGAMMTWAVYREQMKRGLKPGTKYVIPAYEPSIAPASTIPMDVEILETEMIDLFGRKVQAVRTRQVMHITNMLGQKSDIETLSWMTEDGNIVRSRLEILNLPIEIVAATKSVALAPNEPTELMMDTLISVDKPINTRGDRIAYRISLREKSDQIRLSEVPETDMQKVVRRSPSSLEIVVSRRSGKDGKPDQKQLGSGQSRPLTEDERKRYLATSSVVNYKDPAVADLARQAAGNEKDPLKLAEKLCMFVSDYVEDKNLNVGFATASETARSKEGDCTEHGVLLAALGRAVGFPTRLVTGLVYAGRFAGKEGVFVGHLWTQFYVNGQWVDLDAALGQTHADATHIALGLSDAGDTGIADMVSSVWLNMGKLQISVLDGDGPGVATRPTTRPAVRRAAPAAASRPR